MAFLDHVLQPPSYGWKDANEVFIKPSTGQILREFASRLNVFKNRKNWLPFFSWFKLLLLLPFLFLFVFKFFTWWGLAAGFMYGMVIMGTHGTIWYHRFGTHAAYKFKNSTWRFITRNLTLSIIPEEIYVLSHHVHHAKSDTAGDPYFAEGGFLYCFLADVNHQPIAKDLSEKDYYKAVNLMKHTGIGSNTYLQYQHWGSIAKPLGTILHSILNWAFWYGIFFLIGGHQLAVALFAGAFVWAAGVRTFNYEGHGKGTDKRKEGVDYNRNDKSINQIWPGYVAGEWHNNHHLYPKSARSGFLPYQLDLAWCYVWLLAKIGGITSYNDSKKDFYARYYRPSEAEKIVLIKKELA
jgi:stearoyl-CoA desaturase (delta-9 desaturase)